MVCQIKRRDDAEMLRPQRFWPFNKADGIAKDVMRSAGLGGHGVYSDPAQTQIMAGVWDHHRVASQADRARVSIFGGMYDDNACRVCPLRRF